MKKVKSEMGFMEVYSEKERDDCLRIISTQVHDSSIVYETPNDKIKHSFIDGKEENGVITQKVLIISINKTITVKGNICNIQKKCLDAIRKACK